MLDFTPWSERNSEPEPRIHEELTERARVSLSTILLQRVESEHIREAYVELIEKTGQEISSFDVSTDNAARDSLHSFIRNEDEMDLILTYTELLLNIAWTDVQWNRSRRSYIFSENDIFEMAAKIQKTLIKNGITVQLKPSADEIQEQGGYRPSKGDWVKFQQVSDETIIEADQEVRTLALGEPWEEPLEGYNEAWKMYGEGELSYVIPEKLYNSLEAVCTKICVELEDWEDESATVGDCLGTMREKGLFEPNDAMVAEWQQIQGGLQIGVQKLGKDRKRHEEIDQDYAILLLHQTSAFLSFVIKRYEANYG